MSGRRECDGDPGLLGFARMLLIQVSVSEMPRLYLVLVAHCGSNRHQPVRYGRGRGPTAPTPNTLPFGERLRALGFSEDTSEGASLCRCIHSGTILDVMPLDERILGFSHRWYRVAMDAATLHQLFRNLEIRVVTAQVAAAATPGEPRSGRFDLRHGRSLHHC